MPSPTPRATASDPVVSEEVNRLLDDVPAYHQLEPATQKDLAHSMAKITEALAGGQSPLAQPLAPGDLRDRMRRGRGRGRPGRPGPRQERPAAGQQPEAATPPQSPTARVGEVARSTLDAISFPEFVASLLQGTFQAIVDATIQQMEAYAELIHNVAGTVDQFMQDNISEGTARDYLVDSYPGFIVRDDSGDIPRLGVARDGVPEGEMPSFFRDLGFDTPDDLDDDSLEEVVVPAARRSIAERRQQLLSTMVLLGTNRVVVDDGEINAKLQFHIDASESTNLRFDQTKVTNGNISGRSGRSPYTAQGLLVNTTSLNAQSDINVRADLTGQVKVRFRNETFPLEKFAEPLAIQMINQNARVPERQQVLDDATDSGPGRESLAPTASSAGRGSDPWTPRGGR